ncbi:MAG: hypothetical protein P8J14_09100 [Emcibacteraceae bacterium]|nr:hypothetical protein [Emcibacteraceae bacterium]
MTGTSLHINTSHFVKVCALASFGATLFITPFAHAQDTASDQSFDAATIEDDYVSVPLVEENVLTFTTGYDYSSGKFNLPRNTNISYVPYALKYEFYNLTFRASSGYISFAGPRNVITADNGAPLVTDIALSDVESLTSRRKSGFGDVYLSAGYSFENPYMADFFIDLTGQIKLPTADENKGLGTGEVDYTLKLDAAYLFGNFMPFGTIGYRFVGQSELYDLQNSFFASIGMAYYLTFDTSIGVSYDYRESATPGFNSPKEIFTYVDFKLDENWGFNVYGVVGLNNITTDYGLGTQIRYKF